MSWLAGAGQRAHDPPEIVCHRRRLVTLLNFFDSSKPRSSRAAGVAHVSEGSFDFLAPQALQLAASVAVVVSAVTTIRRLRAFRLAFPRAGCFSFGLGDVGANVCLVVQAV